MYGDDKMNAKQIQQAVNEIAAFLAVRAFDTLDYKSLEKVAGLKKVDILVLLGNSIPYTIQCAATAYKNNSTFPAQISKQSLNKSGLGGNPIL